MPGSGAVGSNGSDRLSPWLRRSGRSGQCGRSGRSERGARRDGAPADHARQRHLHRGAGHRLRLRRSAARPIRATGGCGRACAWSVARRFDGRRHLARLPRAGAAFRDRPGRRGPLHPLACRPRLRSRRPADLQLPPARVDPLLRLRRDHEPDAPDLHLRLRGGQEGGGKPRLELVPVRAPFELLGDAGRAGSGRARRDGGLRLPDRAASPA